MAQPTYKARKQNIPSWKRGGIGADSLSDQAANTPTQTSSPHLTSWSVIVHPYRGPAEGLDVTDALINAIAERLTQSVGGNEKLNLLEAERLLEQLLLDSSPNKSIEGNET